MAPMGGRVTRVLVAAMLAAFALLAASTTPSAAAHPVTLQGRVTDGAGNGVANVNVSAYLGGPGATCCTWITGVNTDATGRYAITLAHGTYRIQLYPPATSTFVSRWWSATGTARLFDQATDIDLSADTTLPDSALETGFLVSGTVTGGGAPLAGVNVSAYTAGACCSWVAAGVTSAAGTYSFRVPTGTYRLQFYPPQSTTYIAEWWDGAAGGATFNAGVDIPVVADVTGRDAVLALGRRLSGTVTSGGVAVQGANASLFAGGAAATCCTWITGSSTDAAGAFSLVVPDGTYRLSFNGPSGSSLIAEWWDGGAGVGRFEQASDIIVSADQAGLNAALIAGSRISGRVTSDGAAGIAGAGVGAFTGGTGSLCCTWVAGAGTDAGGNYSFVVPTGTYRVQFSGPAASTYMSEWWDGAAGIGVDRFDQALDVAVGSDLTMDAQLAAGVRVSGRVTATDGTTGIGRAGVNAFAGGTATFCCTWVAGTGSDEQGNYSFVLPPGTYRFYYAAPQGSPYIGEWWNGGTGTTRFDQASDVTLASAVSGQDVQLTSGIRISGRVTSDGTTGIPGVGVNAYAGGASAVCCSWAAGTGTDALGSFTLVVPAGTYRIQFYPPRHSSSAFVGEWWNGGTGAPRFDLATDIAALTDVAGRDAVLETGLRITGRVTDVAGNGIANVGAGAFSGGPTATCCTWTSGNGTDAAGNYTLVVPAGTYRIQFYAPWGSPYLGHWWNGGTAGASRFDQAADIPVVADVGSKNATLATGLRISGRVTSDGTTGLAGVGVSAFTGGSGATCCTWISGTGTDGLGNYTLVVPAGTYRVQFYPPRGSIFISQWWTGAGGATSFNLAQDIAVSADVPGRDALLASGLRITGRVTSAGVGIANVGVSAYVGGSSATCCTWTSGTGTDGLGNYTLVVPAGTYRLQIWPPRGSSFLGQWWTAGGGVTRFDLASDVAVTGDVSLADIALQSGFRISGRVTDGLGNGLANAGISAYLGGISATCCTWVNGTGTDSNGNYALAVPAGTYRLQVFAPYGSTFLGRWWTSAGSATNFTGAGDIVLGGSDEPGKNVTLDTGVVISGTITSAATTTPIQGVWVNAMACNPGCSWVAGASTGADGVYRLAVPAGTYKLQFYPPQGSVYVGQWYQGASNSASATDVVVGTSAVGSKDAALATGLAVTGSVRNTSGGAIPNANVNAQICTSSGSCTWVAGANTAADGAYRLVVAPGTYKLYVNAPWGSSYIGEWYQNASSSLSATPVDVTTVDVPLPDVVLAAGVGITGTVRNAASAAIQNANVNAQICTSSGCTWVAGTNTAADGRYRLIVPGSASYKIFFSPPFGSSYVGQWYQNASGPSTATPVPVATAEVANIDATLATGVGITGTVRSETSVALQNANVSAQTCTSSGSCSWVAGTNTAADGTFRLVVPPGTYKVYVSPPFGSSYLGEWYQNASSSLSATPVTVSSVDFALGDIELLSGFAITGRVSSNATSPTTSGLQSAGVNAQTCTSSGSCTYVAGTGTAADGTYRLVVPNGAYKIYISPPFGSPYIGEWYQNATSSIDALTVTVAGADQALGDVILAQGFAVTGRVSSNAADPTATGIPGANVSAQICSPGCTWMAGASTAADGTYRLIVGAGTYKIHVNAPTGTDYLSEWYQDATTTTAALDVTVSADRTLDDVILELGFAITGRVSTNAADPASSGLPNAQVMALSCPSSGGCSFVAFANTAADGTYRLIVRNGTYKINISAPFGSLWVGEWYQDATNSNTAQAVTVAGGPQALDPVILAPGFAITGTVSGPGGVLANANVNANICSPGCTFIAGTSTAADGTYRLVVPTGGSYKVVFSASGHVTQWFSNKTTSTLADSVTDANATPVNATLAPTP